jgi:LysR family glycine cleavage system transcriptional activator
VAHRLIYRREERDNPEIQAFVDWLMGKIAEGPPAGRLAGH